MKGQLTVEYYISLIIFALFIAYLAFQLIKITPNFMNALRDENLRIEAYKLSELLINDPGEPIDWEKKPSLTEVLRPNAPGDECNIDYETGESCPNHYQNVDEVEADGDATMVFTLSVPYQRDLYNVADQSKGSGTINYIKVYAVCKTNVGRPSQTGLKIAIKSGTGADAPDTVSEGSEEVLSWPSYSTYSNQWSTNPATGGAWTWDEINNLQIGIALRQSASNGHSFCTQVYVEVGYTPPIELKRIGLSSNENKTNLLSQEKINIFQAKCSSNYEGIRRLTDTEYYFSLVLINRTSNETLIECKPIISPFRGTNVTLSRLVALDDNSFGELIFHVW